eukprot:2837740-Pyramimonas_sp.AAC.1
MSQLDTASSCPAREWNLTRLAGSGGPGGKPRDGAGDAAGAELACTWADTAALTAAPGPGGWPAAQDGVDAAGPPLLGRLAGTEGLPAK